MNRGAYGIRKRVMVTGGAGFIGSHLCKRLLRDDCDVLCVDNFLPAPATILLRRRKMKRSPCTVTAARREAFDCASTLVDGLVRLMAFPMT